MSVRKNLRAHRRGLSFVEFVGCIFAIAGGVVIGSMYLGIDVEEAAVRVLQYTEIIPPAEAGAKPPGATTTAAGAAPAEQTADAATPPADTTSVVEPGRSDGHEAIMLTQEQRDELTRNYWEKLNARMKAEVAHRGVQPAGGLQLHDYLTHRTEGHRAAAEGIGELKLYGVDGHVAAYARRVQAWHEAGAEMFAHAKDLVTDAPTATVSGPFAQEWQSAATQHQMEERLLAEKHFAVQSYLDHAGRADAGAAAAVE